MPQGIGSALGSFGSALSSIPSSVGSWFSPSAAAGAAGGIPSVDNPGITAPVPMETSGVGVSGDSSGGLMAAPAPDPSVANYFTGGLGPNPTPTDLAYPAASAMGPTGGVGFNPVRASEMALSGAFGQDVTDPMTGQPLATAIGDPESQSRVAQVLQALGLGGKGGMAAGVGGIGNLVENLVRWQTMRTLQNPAALASGAQQMYRPMSKALKRNIINPVTAAAQETGQINAPGLYSQSVATALAPYQYQMQMKALEDYIEALRASGGAYPEGGVQLGGYGGSSSGNTAADIFGGSSS